MTGTSANDDCVADGIPMGLEQMQEYLQGLYGIPIALREQGTNTIRILSLEVLSFWDL